MEPENSLTCSRNPTSYIHLQAHHPCPYPLKNFLDDIFNIILLSAPMSFMWCLSFRLRAKSFYLTILPMSVICPTHLIPVDLITVKYFVIPFM